ncbi:MAG TPA: hypothetical protein VNE82_02220 [Candidatus Binataceae bacterium]|nr:hypothetical protein [Candidatus Binataceae bacterium]
MEKAVKRRSFFRRLFAVFATGLGYLSGIRGAAARAGSSGVGAEVMTGGGMMGGGMMGGMMSDENMRGPMRTGMELFARHAEIRRTVIDVPGGVRAETTSSNPKTAALIQEHVGEMYQRLEHGEPFPYPASRSVPAMFANSTHYRRKLDALANGVAVTETSADPEMVEVIRAHAREVTGFVKEGMPAMMRDMM